MRRVVSICIFCFMLLAIIVVILTTTKSKKEDITTIPESTEKAIPTEMESETDMIKTNKFEEPYEYIILEKDGHLQVFYSDNKTLFFDSGIQTQNLTEEQKNKVKSGIRFTDVDELYEFLENYSS